MYERLDIGSLKMKLVLEISTFSQDEGKYDMDYSEMVVENFKVTEWSAEALKAEVDRIAKLFELEIDESHEDGFFRQSVSSWSIEEDSYVTPYDLDQEKYANYGDPVRYWSPLIDLETNTILRKLRGWDGKMYHRITTATENGTEYKEVCVDA